MSWVQALHSLPAMADAAGMKTCNRKPSRHVAGDLPHDRILGAWDEVRLALYNAAGTSLINEAGRRLRFHGMSLRITDVILAMRQLREQLSTAGELNERDVDLYEELATRAVMSIRATIRYD